jgi:hypothetical protein
MPDIDTFIDRHRAGNRHDPQRNHPVNMRINRMSRIGGVQIADQKFPPEFPGRVPLHIILIRAVTYIHKILLVPVYPNAQ